MPVWKVIGQTREGRFELRLSNEERRMLRQLPAQLRSLLDERSDDPSLRRLFPPAYDCDAGAQAEYRELMHGELLGWHREALSILEQTAGRDELRAEEVNAWLTALNDLRLVLGTRLGVTEDMYELDPHDPANAELGVYLYLTWLQEQFVEAVASAPQ